MTTDLLQYFQKRCITTEPRAKPAIAPFITFSRQTGCNSIAIAKLLKAHLDQIIPHKWQLVSKEIIELSAHKLQLDPRQVRHIFDPEKCGHIDEILRSMSSKYYKSDKTIRKTIREIIRDMVTDGHIILVGRAGVVITNDLKNGLHVRLHAPLDWRISNISVKKNMNRTDAETYIRNSDENREKLIYDFGGRKVTDIDFDLSFNNARLSDDEIALIIFEVLKKRNMVL